MQEHSRLCKQPLWRSRILDDDGLGEFSQPRLLLGGKVLPRIDDHRQIIQAKFFLDSFQQFETRHVRKTDIDDDAIEVCGTQGTNCFIAARSRYSLDIAIADQVYDGFALAFIVLDNQQALYITAKELPDDIETVRKRLVTRMAFNKSECSKGQCALALCLIRNDLNRNMASCKVAVEAI